ncbi:MAG: 4-(cytidine 5'-diphospho)-2-C-methyl-D-erythritol kinase [Prolixibacteraceae bacterium]
MITYPIAKINIGLQVTGKRPDGYHNIETIFYPVEFHDALEVIESRDMGFRQTGLHIEGDPQKNLVIQAYDLLRANYTIPPVQIYLHKNIPTGAGLGGGSSDGAYMLMLLNDLFQLGISREKLMQYALILGSDCPFFIHGKPVFATGRGEIMEDVQVQLKDYFLILVKPPVHVSTADAYRNILPGGSRLSLKALVGFPVGKWKGNVLNQFERYVFKLYPEVGQIKQTLYEQGASFALMSGSGSCVYGLFRSEKRMLENLFPHDYQIFRQRL